MSKEKEVPVDIVQGMVLHTDGGSRPNPGPGGWGIHGYLYNAIKPKKGSGNPDYILTSAGYVEKVEFNKQGSLDWKPEDFQKWLEGQSNKHLDITPISYIDGYGWFSTIVSNNICELMGAAIGLEYAANHDIKIIQILTDSQYVCKGLAEYVPTWIKNNWIKSDGMPVKNSECWKRLVSARDVLLDRGAQVRVSWVKGHNGHLGNELADQAATLGVINSQQEIWSSGRINTESLVPVISTVEMNLEPADGYWKYDANRHPFISMPRLYFNTNAEFLKPGEYYLSNAKEEDHPGKRIADGAYALVKLKDPDPMIEMIRKHQCELAENLTGISFARLDFIFKPDIHKKISTHGPIVMVQPDKNRLDLFDLHSLDKDKTREPITRELRPPHLAMRAVEEIETLMTRLNQYLSNSSEIVKTELTDILYEKSQKIVKKETVDICTLKPMYNVGFVALPVEANYQSETGIEKASVTLTLSIDLPDRNALKRLETYSPKVTLISWLEAPQIFRYATVIETQNDIGIWAGTVSNLRIVNPQS